jgi:hypothetical protein
MPNDLATLIAKGFVQSSDGTWYKPDASVASRPQTSKPESPASDESLAAPKISRCIKTRFNLRFSQFTRRLQDPDNCCPKYHIDWLRSKGFLEDDTLEDIELTIRQIKVQNQDEEGVLIELL